MDTPGDGVRDPAATDRGTVKTINLALQGGGAHGAFAWGVLDRLLEDQCLAFEGISASSAGAMNAAVCAYGLTVGGRQGAREALEGTSLLTQSIGEGVISRCAGKRDIEFRRCSWRSAVGVVGIRTVMPGVSNELGGRRVRGCLVWG